MEGEVSYNDNGLTYIIDNLNNIKKNLDSSDILELEDEKIINIIEKKSIRLILKFQKSKY